MGKLPERKQQVWGQFTHTHTDNANLTIAALQLPSKAWKVESSQG